MKRFFREILALIITGVVIFVLLQTTIQSFVVVGISMEPTFEEGQRLLINKAVYRFREPQRGEVIVFHPPDNRRADYIKRIIASSGDTVDIAEGIVYIDDSAIDEPYIKEPPAYTYRQQEIAENEYFVLGDNRNNSNDSHNGWIVKREDIIGKAWLSMWPPSQWGLVTNYPLQEQLPSTKLLPQLP